MVLVHLRQFCPDPGGDDHQGRGDQDHQDPQRGEPPPQSVLGEPQDLDGQDLRTRPGEDDGEAEFPDKHVSFYVGSRRKKLLKRYPPTIPRKHSVA